MAVQFIILPTNIVQSAAAPRVAGEMFSPLSSSHVLFLVTLLIGPRLQQRQPCRLMHRSTHSAWRETCRVSRDTAMFLTLLLLTKRLPLLLVDKPDSTEFTTITSKMNVNNTKRLIIYCVFRMYGWTRIIIYVWKIMTWTDSWKRTQLGLFPGRVWCSVLLIQFSDSWKSDVHKVGISRGGSRDRSWGGWTLVDFFAWKPQNCAHTKHQNGTNFT